MTGFRHLLLVLLILLLALLLPLATERADAQESPVAQETRQEYRKGKVTQVLDDGVRQVSGREIPYQLLRVTLDDGEEVTIEHGALALITPDQKVSVGDSVIVTAVNRPNGVTEFYIADQYRLNVLLYIVAGFVILVVVVAGRKGMGALIGLGVSLFVIWKFIIPQIINGIDPALISVAGAMPILLVTMYLAHGVSRQTTIALLSTYAALLVTIGLSIAFVEMSHLTGMGSEDTANLKMGATSAIDIKGLLLAGIIIGTLGALDDMTTTQSATIFELHRADPTLGFGELARRGFSVGREHIVSLVNTLVLAYAGSSLVVFIFLNLNPADLPLWLMINSELVGSEIVRAVAGSAGLVMAIPVTTIAASWFATRGWNRIPENEDRSAINLPEAT